MYKISDFTMELIAHLYSFMDDEDKAAWSMEEAQKMVDDQVRYEIQHGFASQYYSARDFYEIILEFIRQDAEEEDD